MRAELWANAVGHPTIWIRWTEDHEAMVESSARPKGKFGEVARLVKCGPYGEWYVGDWRPRCASCHGTRQVELGMDRDSFAAVVETVMELDQDCRGLDAALWQLAEGTLVECPDCLAHPGWVVG